MFLQQLGEEDVGVVENHVEKRKVRKRKVVENHAKGKEKERRVRKEEEETVKKVAVEDAVKNIS